MKLSLVKCVFFQMGMLRKGKINIQVNDHQVLQTKLPMLHQPCHQWLQICPHRHCHCHPGRQSCHQKPMPNWCFSQCWDYSNLEKPIKKVNFDKWYSIVNGKLLWGLSERLGERLLKERLRERLRECLRERLRECLREPLQGASWSASGAPQERLRSASGTPQERLRSTSGAPLESLKTTSGSILETN